MSYNLRNIFQVLTDSSEYVDNDTEEPNPSDNIPNNFPNQTSHHDHTYCLENMSDA